MKNYDRRHISEAVLTLAGQIHPAYCVGRKAETLNDTTKENFAKAFFASASSKQLELLWGFAEKQAEHGELLISFSVKDGKDIRSLTDEEMRRFTFTEFNEWEIHSLTLTEDELREIPQAHCTIVFSFVQ